MWKKVKHNFNLQNVEARQEIIGKQAVDDYLDRPPDVHM